jgi:hypothetical protein
MMEERRGRKMEEGRCSKICKFEGKNVSLTTF